MLVRYMLGVRGGGRMHRLLQLLRMRLRVRLRVTLRVRVRVRQPPDHGAHRGLLPRAVAVRGGRWGPVGSPVPRRGGGAAALPRVGLGDNLSQGRVQ